MDLEGSRTSGKTAAIVLVLVFAGVGIVGVGGYLVWKRQARAVASSGAEAVPASLRAWCDLRADWGRRALDLAGDIMVAAATPGQEKRARELDLERNKLCQRQARKLRELLASDAKLRQRVEPVEAALEAEGKARADLAVAIHNLTVDAATADMDALEKLRKRLLEEVPAQIAAAKRKADEAFAAAVAGLPCKHIYRGPRTDADTADNPYVTWEELEVRRVLALKRVEDRIVELAPEVRLRALVADRVKKAYRRDIAACFARAGSGAPEAVSLHLRLSKAGKVKRLGVEPAGPGPEKVLDCLLGRVGRWRLPSPPEDGKLVVVEVRR